MGRAHHTKLLTAASAASYRKDNKKDCKPQAGQPQINDNIDNPNEPAGGYRVFFDLDSEHTDWFEKALEASGLQAHRVRVIYEQALEEKLRELGYSKDDLIKDKGAADLVFLEAVSLAALLCKAEEDNRAGMPSKDILYDNNSEAVGGPTTRSRSKRKVVHDSEDSKTNTAAQDGSAETRKSKGQGRRKRGCEDKGKGTMKNPGHSCKSLGMAPGHALEPHPEDAPESSAQQHDKPRIREFPCTMCTANALNGNLKGECMAVPGKTACTNCISDDLEVACQDVPPAIKSHVKEWFAATRTYDHAYAAMADAKTAMENKRNTVQELYRAIPDKKDKKMPQED
ncbi:hypothetical protein VTJ49DRAFT_4578 [Mycothermus thermophilus]|uniref:Uncharacterized protein n=1 Tax=Humicola insolens TaxID=85995 RepID=A0ABR3VLF0_HUMIN